MKKRIIMIRYNFKKILLYFILILSYLIINVNSFNVDIVSPPTDNQYFINSFFLNVSTQNNVTNCTQNINMGFNYTIFPSSSTFHYNFSVDISSMPQGGLTLNVDCYDVFNTSIQNSSSRSFFRDSISPTTNHSYSLNWESSPFNITLNATDSVSGVNYTSFQLNGSGYVNATLVSINTTGNFTLNYFSVDNVGNVESTNTIYALLDMQVPSTSDDNLVGWQNNIFNITLNPIDLHSGVNYTEFNLGNNPSLSGTNVVVNESGNFTLNYFSVDMVGNFENNNSIEVLLDLISPITTDDNPVGWQVSPFNITLVAFDNLSGINYTNYSINSQSFVGTNIVINVSGNLTINYSSVDIAGNIESTNTIYALLDMEPPISSDDNLVGWQNSPFNVTLSSVDNLSGINYTEFKLGNNPSLSGTNVVVNESGNFTLNYFSVDMVGNFENNNSIDVLLDLISPITTDDAVTNFWFNNVFNITLSSQDNLSGVNFTSYKLNGGLLINGTNVVINISGNSTLVYYSLDNVGNKEINNTLNNILLDLIFPVTTHNNPAGWQASPFNITLVAFDNLSGINYTNYSINSQSFVGTNIIINVSGNLTINYSSVDIAGNIESTNTIYALLDMQAPSTTSDSSPGVWFNSPYNITLSPTDLHSGVNYTSYKLNGASLVNDTSIFINNNGNNTIVFFSVDNLGNVENNITQTNIFLDTISPITTHNNPSGWRSSPFTIVLNATDNLSGINYTNYSINSQSFVGTNIVINVSGNLTINYSSVDIAGNIESTNTIYALLDMEPPISSDNNPVGWQNSPFNVTLSSVDNLSGVSFLIYTIDGGSPINGTTINITFEGNRTITYYAIDNEGNVESINTIYALLDLTPPNITINSPNMGDNFTKGRVTLVSNITDTLTLVDSCWYNINNGINNSFTCQNEINITNLNDGVININVFANDSANGIGNSSISINVFEIPRYSNVIATSPRIYVPNQLYYINLTWLDNTNMSVSLLEFAGVNYTMQRNGDVFNYTLFNLTPGEYTYRFIGNDTSNNFAYSSLRTFYVLANISNESLLVENNQSLVINNSSISQIIVSASSTLQNLEISENISSTKTIVLNLSSSLENTGNLTIKNNFSVIRKNLVSNHSFVFSNSTVVKGDPSWQGIIEAPKISSTVYSITSGSTDLVLEMGSPDFELNFSTPVKITLGAMSGKRGAWSRRGETSLTPINTLCNSVNIRPTNIDPFTNRECYVDSGSNLVIWTYHFTAFAAFTPTSGSQSSGGGGGGGNSKSSVHNIGLITSDEIKFIEDVSKEDTVKFRIDDENSFKVMDLSIIRREVILSFESLSKYLTLEEGVKTKIDLDEDGKEEVEIWFTIYQNNKIRFYFNVDFETERLLLNNVSNSELKPNLEEKDSKDEDFNVDEKNIDSETKLNNFKEIIYLKNENNTLEWILNILLFLSIGYLIFYQFNKLKKKNRYLK